MKNGTELIALKSILWNLFANPDGHNAQDESNFWVLSEGIYRLQQDIPLWREWTWHHAVKGHDCQRGCKIKAGDYYFAWEIGPAWDNRIKVCAYCMAMILYLNRVYELPEHFHSHWNLEKKRPVSPQNEQRNAQALRDIYESRGYADFIDKQNRRGKSGKKG